MLNILVVDDIPQNLYSMKQLLEAEELDINVITAESGLIALEKTLENEISLILMDVQMPEMNGYETAELLRGSKKTRLIPIIFVTANNREENSIFKGYESGAVDYLFKPINTPVLLSKVRIFIELGKQKIELDNKIKELEALKIDLENKNRTLEQLSLEDGLTTLWNRRSFDITIVSEWKRAIRDNLSISLIMIDIDHFKPYNDTYGHQEGDKILRTVAHALKSTLKRPSDTIARYGGEEFVSILPDTDIKGATEVAERMVKAVNDLKIPHKSSTTSDFLTISIGVSSLSPGKDDKPDVLLNRVDKTLYQAKEEGRNRIIVS